MEQDQIMELLKEATGPDCPDERMLAICTELASDKEFALSLLVGLKSSYSDIWISNKSSIVEIDTASVQNVQCFRLKSMFLGEKPMNRLSLEDVRRK